MGSWFNGDNKIDFVELVNIGSVNKVQIETRELFRIAIIKNVTKIILVHNHPSGNVKPSNSDEKLTYQMQKAGDLIGVQILDHIIIAKDKYFSFADEGLL